MSKLTDLEICQRIAEIEGVKDKIEATMMAIRQSSHHSIFATGTVTSQQTFDDIYNPLTDDALCFNLMIKYGIRYDGRKIKGKHHFWFGNIKNKNYIVNFHPNRAICLAIIHLREE
jgi:hypothetical protein